MTKSTTKTYLVGTIIHVEYDRQELRLKTHHDMIHWGGCFYGDREVFLANTDDEA